MKKAFILIKKAFSVVQKASQVTLFLILISLFSTGTLHSQQSQAITGKVLDDQNLPLIGASIYIKGTQNGITSDSQGNFSLPITQNFPVTVVVSFIGLETQEIEVYENQPLQLVLGEKTNKLNEVVVTASRKSEALSKVPVTVETLSAADIKRAPTASFYDLIATLKGVNTLNSSIAFTVYNTRGFQHPTNQRFVQLVDGADNASPELGLPVANTIGPGELDVQNVELIPGASSAIYGLSASNGLLNLITKDPFTYQGLSVSLKSGVNNVNSPFKNKYGIDATSYNNIAIRYARAYNNKFAFKVNLGFLKGQDWASGDFNDIRDWNGTGINNRTDPGYDGANTYGDEGGATNLLVLASPSGTTNITSVSQTGYAENDLTNYNTRLLHADASLVYKFNENAALSYTYRVGEVDNIFTRGNKLKFKDFVVQQHVLQLKTSNLTFRSYLNTENSGSSYNIRYLADALNTAASSKLYQKTGYTWNQTFQSTYNTAIIGGSTAEEASLLARDKADSYRFEPGTASFDSVVSIAKKDGSWKTGAQFVAKGYFIHNEIIYDLSNYTRKIVDVQIGGDYRYSNVSSDGTFFPDTAGNKVYSYKYGGFVQLAKDFIDGKLRLAGSVRYDKARAIDFELTERIGLIFSPNKKNNFRLSYQNGYRLPSFVEGWNYNNTITGIGVGGLEPNLKNSNIVHNSYSFSSFFNFYKSVVNDIKNGISTANALINNNNKLQLSTFDYLKPEQNQTIDLSYKGSYYKNRLYIDLNGYLTRYNDFIQTYTVIKTNSDPSAITTLQGAQEILQGRYTAYQTYSNVTSAVYVYGASVGIDYNFFRKYVLSGNLNYVTLDWGSTPENALSNGFNTPEYNLNVSVSNPDVWKNLGFNILYKWTDKTNWKTDFSVGNVPSWQTIDAQLSYRIPKYNATLALGGTNILNNYYTQYIAGPSIGGFYYASIVFDGLLKK